MNEPEHDLRRQHALARWERQREENASIGWHEVRDEEQCELLFDRLHTLIPSQQPHDVPPPSTTWDVTAATGMQYRSSDQLSLINDLHYKCLQALKRCSVSREPWYVFENCQHPCYRLYVDEMPDNFEGWPIEILPYGDPCYIVASDWSSGIIALLHQSITVFGQPLLSRIHEDLPIALTHVIHSTEP